MTIQGIILIDFCAVLLMLLIVNLVRTGKLYVGYAVFWLLVLVALIVILTSPSLLSLVTNVVGAIYPVSALSLLAFIFIFLLLVFFSVQLSTLSARQLRLIEQMAIKELLEQEKTTEEKALEENTSVSSGK